MSVRGRTAACGLPLEVERHRRSGDRFIVGPAHGDGDMVVGVADQFLVVEENGATRRCAE